MWTGIDGQIDVHVEYRPPVRNARSLRRKSHVEAPRGEMRSCLPPNLQFWRGRKSTSARNCCSQAFGRVTRGKRRGMREIHVHAYKYHVPCGFLTTTHLVTMRHTLLQWDLEPGARGASLVRFSGLEEEVRCILRRCHDKCWSTCRRLRRCLPS